MQTLEWLAAKQYSALLSLNLVPEHVCHLSTLPEAVKRKIVFYLQNAIGCAPEPYHQQILEELVQRCNIEVSLELTNSNNENNKELWLNVLKKCRSMTNKNGINLVGLTCKYWKQSLQNFFQGVNTLQYINISGYQYENADETMFVIAQSCPNLTSINLSRCEALTDIGLLALLEYCKKMMSINLSYVEYITSKSFLKIIQDCPNVTSINIKGNTCIEMYPFIQFFEETQNEDSRNGKRFELLELNMKQVRGVSGKQINDIVSRNLNTLEILKMGDTNFNLNLLNIQNYNRKTLPLQKLDISWCEDCSTTQLISLIEKCPNLKSFKSRACEYVTNDVILALASTCFALEQVNISRCKDIFDDAIILLVKNNCKTLKNLDIAWSKCTNESISFALNYCKYLCILNIEGCKSSDVSEIERLIIQSPLLKYISMAWINSCDDVWAHKIVAEKNTLCIVDYYGEEIRGRLYDNGRHMKSQEPLISCDDMMQKMLVREKNEKLIQHEHTSDLGSDTDYNEYSDDDF
jgi:hypothetical protein